ncbi:MAG: hypothetical protein KDI60_02550, partial [Xanthomonadales bacterium]|nr:hypothetical protein [Xanthomonadales bacterium]
ALEGAALRCCFAVLSDQERSLVRVPSLQLRSTYSLPVPAMIGILFHSRGHAGAGSVWHQTGAA